MKRKRTKQGELTGHPFRVFTSRASFKTGALIIAILVSLSLAFPSIAETTDSGGGLNGTGALGPSASIEMQSQAVLKEAQDCADPTNVKGLAHAQADSIEDMKKMIMTPINTDNLFSTGSKGGCFNALGDFPNLSMSIPSLTSIANALKQTLINYATRKVCTAVNDALSDMIEPLNAALDNLGKNGQIDLTGAVNSEISKKLYGIDPELGRVSRPAKTEYEWSVAELAGNTTDGDTGTGSGGTNRSSGSGNSGSSGGSTASNSSTSGSNGGETSAMQSIRNVINSVF